jgi:hypothetical protein
MTRALSLLLLLLLSNLQQSNGLANVLERFPFFTLPSSKAALEQQQQQRNAKVQALLNAAAEIGPVGSLASEADQTRMEELAAAVIPYSDTKPAQYPLMGDHRLVYSAAPGASSGRLFGNIVGQVSQLFEDDDTFYNRVALGPLQISLKAQREVKNESKIKVTFLETKFSLFGTTLKEGKVGGGGVWKVTFVGTVQDADGKEKLVRVMETPSLFILEQPLE